VSAPLGPRTTKSHWNLSPSTQTFPAAVTLVAKDADSLPAQ
jgi:hypothetical protein